MCTPQMTSFVGQQGDRSVEDDAMRAADSTTRVAPGALGARQRRLRPITGGAGSQRSGLSGAALSADARANIFKSELAMRGQGM